MTEKNELTKSNHSATQSFEQLKTATIMMVDDEPIMMEIVQVFLEEEGYQNFVQVEHAIEAIDVLHDKFPDVVLLDLSMPERNGFDILQDMKTDTELRYIPVIVLTSNTDAESKLRALELGASDFLAKPVDQSELRLRLRNTLSSKAYQDQLAYYDQLTHLPNRSLFIDRLEWTIKSNAREKKILAVIAIGLDRFKNINESLGPKAGDILLKLVAERFVDSLRDIDVVSRFIDENTWKNFSRLGGDEFAIVLPGLEIAENAAFVTKRLLESMHLPFIVNEQEVYVTASAGISLCPGDGTQSDILLKEATSAKDYAKQQGRDNFQFYSKELNARSIERLSLETDLRYAIERNELELYYQPKIAAKNNQLIGSEALLRWNHPKKGLVSPVQFIPLAEELGLIVQIGDWVIQKACHQADIWRSKGLPDLKVSVNVSAPQIRQDNLYNVIKNALESFSLDPKLLVVEITESMMMTNVEEKMSILDSIKELGITFSIDDFGTGYSSLSYLKRMPINELKIDRSFLKDFPQNMDGLAIVKAIIAMAHSLELSVVAEGVETAEQLSILKEAGADIIQGYFFSKPLTADDFFDFSAKHFANQNS